MLYPGGKACGQCFNALLIQNRANLEKSISVRSVSKPTNDSFRIQPQDVSSFQKPCVGDGLVDRHGEFSQRKGSEFLLASPYSAAHARDNGPFSCIQEQIPRVHNIVFV